MSSNRVVHEMNSGREHAFRPISEEETRSLIAMGLQRHALEYGLETTAERMVCTTRCVRKALALEAMPKADKLGNLMAIEPSAFIEWFARLGLRVSFADTAMTPDMELLLMLSEAGTEFVRVLQDNRRSPQETLRLAKLFRPMLPRMAAIVQEADDLLSPSDKLRVVA